MNGPLFEPPGHVYEAESSQALHQILGMELGQLGNSEKDCVLRSKKVGDILLTFKRRGEPMMEVYRRHGISRSRGARLMQLADNWKDVGHPASVSEALRMIHDKEEDTAPVPLVASTNPPLCFRCNRLVRTHGQAPKKGCADCKAVRESAQRAVGFESPQRDEEGAKDEEVREDEGEEEGQEEAAPPKATKTNGSMIPTTEDFTRTCGLLLKQIDVLARVVGVKRGNGQAAVETPEMLGFRRQIEEMEAKVWALHKVVKKWYERQKPKG